MDIRHVGLVAFILLLTTPRYIRKNVLYVYLRIYFCAYVSIWMRANQVNVNWNVSQVDKRTQQVN
jgi:hypothetical protein